MSKAMVLPIYHPMDYKSKDDSSEICDYLFRAKKFKILSITFVIFLCSLWIVTNCDGSAIISRVYYTKNRNAALAASWVLGEGSEEGIHGLEVENHDRSSFNHDVHYRENFHRFLDLLPPPQQQNVAQQRFEEALKHDVDIEDYIYVDELETEIYELIHGHSVVMFSKSHCPYSRKAKHILSRYNILPRPIVVEVDERDDADEVKQILINFTYQSTFPNIFINGISIGGSEELSMLSISGRLQEILVEAGILYDSDDSKYEIIRPAL